MLKSSFFVTTIVFLALLFFLLQELRFLIPYRQVLVYQYGWTILSVSLLLVLNLLVGVFITCRRFFLKNTGEKLAHLEKQLRSSHSISQELSLRLEEEE